MKKLLSLLALLLILVGCSVNAQDNPIYYYSISAPDILKVDEDTLISIDKIEVRELTEKENQDFQYIKTIGLGTGNLNELWSVYEITFGSQLESQRIDFIEQFKPVVIDGYKEVYRPTHYMLTEKNTYQVLIPKDLLKTEQLSIRLNDEILMDLNFVSR